MYMSEMQPLWHDDFDLAAAIDKTKQAGWYFTAPVAAEELRSALEAECNALPLELEDRITFPINPDKPNQVYQQHARAYYEYGDASTPVANYVISALTEAVHTMQQFPE